MARLIPYLAAFLCIIPLPWCGAYALRAPFGFDAVDALIAPLHASEAPGVSVAIRIGGEIAYERWGGLADVEQQVPIDADTRFAMGSLSKQVTAFAIMMLAEEGKLSLDQDIRDFLPEMAERDVPITVRHLLGHRSGLHEANSLLQIKGRSEDSPVTQEQALFLIMRQKDGNFLPGTDVQYNNSGYMLLAEIVARLSGQPFTDFVRERLFEPLGMNDSFFRTDASVAVAHLAHSYAPHDDIFARQHLLTTTIGSTGLVSTAGDMLRWAENMRSGKVGGLAVIERMAARQFLPDGRESPANNGQEYREFRGLDTWSHGGSTAGYRSFLLRLPELDADIVLLSNRADPPKAKLAFDIAAATFADRMKPEASGPVERDTPETLERYVGDYELFAGIVFSIRRDGDRLTFSTYGQDALALESIDKGVFMLNPARGLRIEFRDFADGSATRLRWQISEDGYIPAPRVEMAPFEPARIDPTPYAGHYFSAALLDTITLLDEEGSLSLRLSNGDSVVLEEYQPGLLRPLRGDSVVTRVRVERDARARIIALHISAPLADDIPYVRLDPANGVWGR